MEVEGGERSITWLTERRSSSHSTFLFVDSHGEGGSIGRREIVLLPWLVGGGGLEDEFGECFGFVHGVERREHVAECSEHVVRME